MKTRLLLLFYFFLSSSALLLAQQSEQADTNVTDKVLLQEFKLNGNKSTFLIKGTSSLHDWEMISKSFNGFFIVENAESANPTLKDIQVTLGVTTLESDNRVMNKKTYDALKNDEHPKIYYKLKQVKSIKAIGNDTYKAILNGTLTIAGKSKVVDIAATLVLNSTKVSIHGEKALKMSDFDVEPPTALLGTLKTGNDITIEFNLNYL
ncbi:YceI family protein [Altibacter sp.]|uniref:YceI family protein n=1 Tax=Altibacter sp. TaxID=2024823 RepID=UPI0025885F67|nr:YceI family protein [Altibacter sp.]MCW8981005.1 YceI family protein [Altibacter sp.]MCW9037706.1 YceI family protein [Altibacter sp.]